ncbi:MAG TPA: hypothetical protein VLE96_03470 [Chlamydiales bacterium]|nr:hypothetical protein [Chlamydiales bacterium]
MTSAVPKNTFTFQVCSNVCPYVEDQTVKDRMSEILKNEREKRQVNLSKNSSKPIQNFPPTRPASRRNSTAPELSDQDEKIEEVIFKNGRWFLPESRPAEEKIETVVFCRRRTIMGNDSLSRSNKHKPK